MSEINPVIMDRGRQYWLDGNILLLEEISDLVYRAEVKGSAVYEVTVVLDQDDTILESECDCPYDYSPICKHQAAVLLKLQNAGEPPSNQKSSSLSPGPKDSLESLLESQSKEILVDLLLSIAADSDVVEQRIKLKVSRHTGDDEAAESRKLMQSYINSYSDKYGFVDYRNVFHAVEGAELVAQKAQEAINNKDWIQAVRIDFCILEEMLTLIQSADDSAGEIGAVIEESLARIREVTLESEGLEEQELLFHLLLKESAHSLLDGWSDWRLTLLELASHLALTEEWREEWEKHVQRITAQQSEDTWSKNYFLEQLALMRYELIRNYQGEQQAEDYLNHHLNFPAFREKGIRIALDRGQYDEAIGMAMEGESQDQTLPGLVKKWKQLRYEAAQRSQQLDLQRQTGKELVLDGDYSYYQQLKDSYPPAQWPDVYQEMLQHFERQHRYPAVYTEILIEEQETSRLLTYVKQHASLIEQYYPYLVEKFPLEVAQLFRDHIEMMAAGSTTRAHYQNVCRIIRIFQQAAGQEEALNITHRLLAKYPKKPAFRDELRKFEQAR